MSTKEMVREFNMDGMGLRLRIEEERETDSRWIAEIAELPGVLVYGANRRDALTKVKALALRVLASRLEHGDAQDLTSVEFSTVGVSQT